MQLISCFFNTISQGVPTKEREELMNLVWKFLANGQEAIFKDKFYLLYSPRNAYFVKRRKKTEEEEFTEFKKNFSFPIVDLINNYVSYSDFIQYHTILSCSIELNSIFGEQMVCISRFSNSTILFVVFFMECTYFICFYSSRRSATGVR